MSRDKPICSITILITILLLSSIGNLPFNIDIHCNYDFIYGQTDYKREAGIRLVSTNELIQNKIFVNIPIGVVSFFGNTTIRNCIFINCSDEGILLIGNNNIVDNCKFYKCGDGIELQSSSNNQITNNLFVDNHCGIDAIYNSNNNNQINNNMFKDNFMGIYFKESENNNFNNNLFLDNDKEIVRR